MSVLFSDSWWLWPDSRNQIVVFMLEKCLRLLMNELLVKQHQLFSSNIVTLPPNFIVEHGHPGLSLNARNVLLKASYRSRTVLSWQD